MKLKFTNHGEDDLVKNYVSVRFASGDEPDVVLLPDRPVALALLNQDQLLDAKECFLTCRKRWNM